MGERRRETSSEDVMAVAKKISEAIERVSVHEETLVAINEELAREQTRVKEQTEWLMKAMGESS